MTFKTDLGYPAARGTTGRPLVLHVLACPCLGKLTVMKRGVEPDAAIWGFEHLAAFELAPKAHFLGQGVSVAAGLAQ